MQQLSGKSIDKFYNSCTVFHQESNKIEIAFFRIFYNFLCILQEPAIDPTLFKKQLYTEVPAGLDSLTNMPSVHGLDLGKKEIEAIESLDQGSARAGWNSPAPAAGAARQGVELVQVLT
jgi:hypothetical protein